MSCRSVVGQLLSRIAVSFGAASSLSDGRRATWSSLREPVIRNHLRMGTSEDFGGESHAFLGNRGRGGFNRPPQNIKGGLWKADYPWRGWGSLEHYRALWGDQVKFIVTQTNPPKRLPSQTINDLSLTSANEEYRFSCRHRIILRLNLNPFAVALQASLCMLDGPSCWIPTLTGFMPACTQVNREYRYRRFFCYFFRAFDSNLSIGVSYRL